MKIQLHRFHDPWFDNGLENFFCLLKRAAGVAPMTLNPELAEDTLVLEVIDEKRFSKVFAQVIVSQRDETVFYWDKDKKTGVKINKKKAFAPLQYASKIKNRNRLLEAVLQDGQAEKIIQDALKDVAQNPKYVCILCGRGFRKPATNLKQAVYPAVTKIKSFTGVRTTFDENGTLKGMVTNYKQLCPWCYLIGGLEWIDSGIIYRSFVNKKSHVLLPAAPGAPLTQLHEVKELYRGKLSNQEKVANIRIRVQKTKKDKDGSIRETFPEGRYTLALAFYELLFEEFGAKKKRISFTDVQREVFREWLVMEVPEGQVKNIKWERLVVPDSILELLATLLEKNIRPYGDALAPFWIVDREGNFPKDNSRAERKEALAAGIITDDFYAFASAFVPRRHRYIAMRRETEESLLSLITEWRKPMGLQQDQFEIVRKAARAVAQVVGTNIAIIYKIEKTKDSTDLLESLKEVAHKLVGAKADQLKYVSLDGLEKFTELLHQSADDRNRFRDLRNSLMILASIEHARQTRKGGESNE